MESQLDFGLAARGPRLNRMLHKLGRFALMLFCALVLNKDDYPLFFSNPIRVNVYVEISLQVVHIRFLVSISIRFET